MMRPMSARDFSTVGVVGLGTMGAGIAEVFARNGYQVVGVEQTEETLKRGRQHVEHSTGRAVKRGKLTVEQQEELVGRITFTTSMADLADCGLVVEAVVEQLPVKQDVIRVDYLKHRLAELEAGIADTDKTLAALQQRNDERAAKK